MSTQYLLMLEHPEDTIPPDPETVRAATQAATGLATTLIPTRGDVHLEYQETGRPPVMVEGGAADHAFAGFVTVKSLIMDTPALGYMPALGFEFDAIPTVPPILMVGDEPYLRSMGTLVTNAAAGATKNVTAQRRRAGQGPIPRLWTPGR